MVAMWTAVVWTAEVRRHKHSDSQMRAGYIWDWTDWGGLGYFVSTEPLLDTMMMTSPPSTVQICSAGAFFQRRIGFTECLNSVIARDCCDIQRL